MGFVDPADSHGGPILILPHIHCERGRRAPALSVASGNAKCGATRRGPGAMSGAERRKEAVAPRPPATGRSDERCLWQRKKRGVSRAMRVWPLGHPLGHRRKTAAAAQSLLRTIGRGCRLFGHRLEMQSHSGDTALSCVIMLRSGIAEIPGRTRFGRTGPILTHKTIPKRSHRWRKS